MILISIINYRLIIDKSKYRYLYVTNYYLLLFLFLETLLLTILSALQVLQFRSCEMCFCQ